MGAASLAPEPVLEFQRNVVAVVGAADDVGEALCRYVGHRGAFTGIVDGGHTVAALVQELRDARITVAPSVVDLGNPTAVLAAFRHVVARLGPVDILINNAGGHVGARHCIDAVLPDMTARQRGLIINLVGRDPATRSDVRRLVRMSHADAVRYAGFGIHVCAVHYPTGRDEDAASMVRAVADLVAGLASAALVRTRGDATATAAHRAG